MTIEASEGRFTGKGVGASCGESQVQLQLWPYVSNRKNM